MEADLAWTSPNCLGRCRCTEFGKGHTPLSSARGLRGSVKKCWTVWRKMKRSAKSVSINWGEEVRPVWQCGQRQSTRLRILPMFLGAQTPHSMCAPWNQRQRTVQPCRQVCSYSDIFLASRSGPSLLRLGMQLACRTKIARRTTMTMSWQVTNVPQDCFLCVGHMLPSVRAKCN